MDPNFKHFLIELFDGPYLEKKDLNLRKKKNYEPKGLLTVSLIDMFPKVVAVLEDELTLFCSRTSKRYLISTNSSTEFYVSYLFCTCLLFRKATICTYDLLLFVLSLVVCAVKIWYESAGRNLYKLTPFILAVFFELYLIEDFEKRGGWKHLEKHILRKKYNEYYDLLKVSGPAVLDDLRTKIRDRLLSKLLLSRIEEEEVKTIRLEADKLSNNLLRSLEAPLLHELNTVVLLNKEQSVAAQAEGPSSSKTKNYNSQLERRLQCDLIGDAQEVSSSLETSLLDKSNTVVVLNKEQSVAAQAEKLSSSKRKDVAFSLVIRIRPKSDPYPKRFFVNSTLSTHTFIFEEQSPFNFFIASHFNSSLLVTLCIVKTIAMTIKVWKFSMSLAVKEYRNDFVFFNKRTFLSPDAVTKHAICYISVQYSKNQHQCVNRTVTHEKTGFSPTELVMGKNLRTPQTLIYERWFDEKDASQSVVEYIIRLVNRLKHCQDLAMTRMKQ
ncbi:uncharacterized protein NPIL_310731 [Nephila pilipes]|uniref:Uncharacterized protein n=1 Tax=Nephila pilipes TaxID=299642 RepID=A0A8X6QTR4_NEPPI|nr:uncharacterized protein NPIL_310731 [Nephila pilipes]